MRRISDFSEARVFAAIDSAGYRSYAYLIGVLCVSPVIPVSGRRWEADCFARTPPEQPYWIHLSYDTAKAVRERNAPHN
jgi:hypothetical protein